MLDNIDGQPDNGFTHEDVTISLMMEDWKTTLKRFYPFYDFRFSAKCNEIQATVNVDRLYSLYIGDIDHDDPRVRALREGYGLFDFQESTLISQANYIHGSALLIAVEDEHSLPHSAHLMIGMVDNVLSRQKHAYLFVETQGAPAIFDESHIDPYWQTILQIMTTKDISDVLSAETRNNASSSGQLKRIYNALHAVRKTVPSNVIRHLTIENSNEMFGEYPAIRDLVISISLQTYLKLSYGDLVTIINPDSLLPVDADLLRYGADIMIPAADWRNTMMIGAAKKYKLPIKNRPYEYICHSVVQTAMMAIVGLSEGLHTGIDLIHERSNNWLGNIMTLAHDSRIQSHALYNTPPGPPIFILFGGALHIKPILEKLNPSFSTMSTYPKEIKQYKEEVHKYLTKQ